MLLWRLIKFLHRCYYAFISEDHYFPRSFFQERGLRLEVKATATRGLEPPTTLAPMGMCGGPRAATGRAVIVELPRLLTHTNRTEGEQLLFIGEPPSL